ncbi:MAG TPA: right-handed parallel beta-helix repeat-containing protein [Hyphomonadaceae bacterium]|jgi:parallel beta-helix repeat protein|nr:right-handed parallel beta-helix repeat-containing protein [Hyphomonadaceae bacterium]
MIVNVQSYGAVGNGVTDDTSAIHAARTAAGVGGIVEFPPGTYLVTGLVANIAKQTWRGQGSLGAAVIKLAANTNANTVLIDANDITLDTLEIDANGTAGNSGSAGIAAYGYTGVRIRTCKIRDAGGYNAFIADCPRAEITKSIFRNAGNISLFYNINAATTDIDGPHIEGNVIDQSMTSPTLFSGCLVVFGTTSHTILDPVITGNSLLGPSSTTSAQGCICFRYVKNGTVVGNTTRGGSMGYTADSARNVSVTGNAFLLWSYYGVELGDGTDYSTVSGNTIDGGNFGVWCISLVGGEETPKQVGISITGNTLSGFKGRVIDGSNVAGVGILIFSASNLTVTGNTINGNQGDFGVYVRGQSEIYFGNNNFFGGMKKALYLRDTPGNITITGGAIVSCSEHDIMIEQAAPISCDYLNVTGIVFKGGAVPGVTILTSSGGSVGAYCSVRGCPGVFFGPSAWGDIMDLGSNIIDAMGNASPEGNVTAAPGSIYRNRYGGNDTTLYTKATGTGNTGWLAVDNV